MTPTEETNPFEGLTSDELEEYIAESEQRPGESATDHTVRSQVLRREYEKLAAQRRVSVAPKDAGEPNGSNDGGEASSSGESQ